MMPTITKIHHLIEAQAQKHPDRIAVSLDHQQLTYATLNRKANQLAAFLCSLGLPVGSFIPLVATKSIHSVIAIVGILKANMAYIPMDHDATDAMIETVIKNANVSCLFVASTGRMDKHDPSVRCFDLDNLDALIDRLPDHQDRFPATASDQAYVIYTSGTTGLPKGVMVTHQNVLHTYDSWERVYQLASSDRHLQMANPAFDVFTGDLVRALCSGGELVLCPKAILLNPERLYQLINEKAITCAEFVPAILRPLLAFLTERQLVLPTVRLLLCGSDLWTMADYRRTQQIVVATARVINSYGLTEATIDSTYFEETIDTREPLAATALVPIGKPFPHVSLYVLNEHQQPVATDEIGELYIGGQGVATGYLGQPALTAERFLTTPATGGARLYKTGDWCQVLADGTLAFLGRNQAQVKINGQRVELLTLESVLNEHPHVTYSIAYALPLSTGESTLACAVLLSDDSVTLAELIHHINQQLPCYYCPQRIDVMDKLVLTANGKINRAMAAQSIVRELPRVRRLPNNTVEDTLLTIWQQTVGQMRIGTTCHFYEIGGSSLALVTMLHQVNQTFDTQLTPNECPLTVELLARRVQALTSVAHGY